MHDWEHGRLVIKAPVNVLEKFERSPESLSYDAMSALRESAGLEPLNQESDIDNYRREFSCEVHKGYLFISFLDKDWADLIVDLSKNKRGLEIYAYIDREYGLFGNLIALNNQGKRFTRFAYYDSLSPVKAEKKWAETYNGVASFN